MFDGFHHSKQTVWSSAAIYDEISPSLQGIGNGLPLAAVVTTPEIAQTLTKRTHFNTYGGNPVSSTAGRAVLRAVDEDGLQANCAQVLSNNLLLCLYQPLQAPVCCLH